MHKRRAGLWLLLSLFSATVLHAGVATAAARAAPAAADGRPRLAVLGVTGGEGFTPKQITTIEELLLVALQESGRIKVVGRTDLDTLVGLEKQRQMAGCSDNVTCIAELAGALGVETVAVADVGRLGSQTVVSVKVIDARNASVRLRAKRVARSDEQLVRVSEELAGEVVASMTGTPVALPQRAVAPAAEQTSATGGSPRSPAWRVAGYVAGGLGVAALGVGAVAGLRANEAGSTLLSKPAASRAEVQSTWESEKSNASLANGLFVAGGILFGAGIGLVVAF